MLPTAGLEPTTTAVSSIIYPVSTIQALPLQAMSAYKYGGDDGIRTRVQKYCNIINLILTLQALTDLSVSE